MATSMQDPRLTMTALGIRGDREVEDGVHLRWSFDPELGFPPEGFNLYYRPTQPRQEAKASLLEGLNALIGTPAHAMVTGGVSIHRADGSPLTVKTICGQRSLLLDNRPLVLRFRSLMTAPAQLVREVTLHLVTQNGAAFAQGKHADRVADCAGYGSLFTFLPPDLRTGRLFILNPDEQVMAGRFLQEEIERTNRPIQNIVDEQSRLVSPFPGPGKIFPAKCKTITLTLRADAMDSIILTGRETGLLALTYVVLTPDECDRQWSQIAGPICLPIDPIPENPCHAGGLSGYEIAKSRLINEVDHPPDAPKMSDLVNRLLGPDYLELKNRLEQMLRDAATTPPHLQVEELSSDDPDDSTNYRLEIVQETLLGSMDPYFARILGLYHVHKVQVAESERDYKIEAVWPIGPDKLRLCWIVFGVQTPLRPPLLVPTGVRAEVIPGSSRVREDGTVSRFQMDVGVSWARPSACDLTDPVRAAAYYFIERTEADAPADGLYTLLNQRIFEEGGAPEPSPAVIVESQAESNPFPVGYFFDRGPGYGKFHYRVRARDLFGRTSPPSEPAAVMVTDLVPPGSPVNLMAEYVDPADPLRAESEALAWANRDTPPDAAKRAAVIVRWIWPIARQRQSPDADEFRIYYRRGPLNVVAGSVTEVLALGDGRFRVLTDLNPAGPNFTTAPAPVDIGILRNEGEEYPIETLHTVGGKLRFVVLANPIAPPMLGQCAFHFGAGIPASGATEALPPYPAYRSFRDSIDWRGLTLSSPPLGIPAPLRVGIDGAWRGPLPPGLLIDDLRVTRADEPGEGGSHWHYELTLRKVNLTTSKDRPRASGFFGVTTADDASPANESRVTPPAGIFAAHRVAPNIPPVSYPDEIFATPADFYGHSYFTVEWTAERSTGYLIYRASDLELLAAAGIDPAAHRALPAPEQRRQLRDLGSRQSFVGAFSAVTAEPLWAITNGLMNYRDRLEGSVENRFVYRIRATDRAGNLAPWPADPAPSDAGKVCVVVGLRKATPPSPPRWAGSEPLETGLALRWIPNGEADLAGYRLYRAYDPAEASETRSMTGLFTTTNPEGAGGLTAVRVRRIDGNPPSTAVEILPPGDTSEGRLIQFVDTAVEGGRVVYYRLIAIDSAGNRSLSSDLLTTRYPKRQPPSPPTWQSVTASGGIVTLAWTAAEPDLESLVLRRSQAGAIWRPIGSWLPRGNYNQTDSQVESGAAYEYRIRVRDRVGHVVDGPVRTMTV